MVLALESSLYTAKAQNCDTDVVIVQPGSDGSVFFINFEKKLNRSFSTLVGYLTKEQVIYRNFALAVLPISVLF